MLKVLRPLIYVAGPYTAPDPVANTRRAIEVGERIERIGADVFIPHLSLLWALVSPAPYERWCERDNAVLDRCDALFRMRGESPGADAETLRASERRIPVIYENQDDTMDLKVFVNKWTSDWVAL